VYKNNVWGSALLDSRVTYFSIHFPHSEWRRMTPPRILVPFEAAPDAHWAADYEHLIGSVGPRAGCKTHRIVASHAAL